MLFRPFIKLIALAPLALGFAGCVGSPDYSGPTLNPDYSAPSVEERYRLFFSREARPNIDLNETTDQIAAHFAPEQSVENTITNYKNEGFQLAEIRTIPWVEGASIFTFRRAAPAGSSNEIAPIQYLGAFKVKSDPATRYVFERGQTGYLIHQIGPEGVKSYAARWEGRELVWSGPLGENRAQLSPDGGTLYLITESRSDAQKSGTVVEAERIGPVQKPESADVRRSYAYLGKPLRPRSPRIYDPFPW